MIPPVQGYLAKKRMVQHWVRWPGLQNHNDLNSTETELYSRVMTKQPTSAQHLWGHFQSFWEWRNGMKLTDRMTQVYSIGILLCSFSTELPLQLLGAQCNNSAKKKRKRKRKPEFLITSLNLSAVLLPVTASCVSLWWQCAFTQNYWFEYWITLTMWLTLMVVLLSP